MLPAPRLERPPGQATPPAAGETRRSWIRIRWAWLCSSLLVVGASVACGYAIRGAGVSPPVPSSSSPGAGAGAYSTERWAPDAAAAYPIEAVVRIERVTVAKGRTVLQVVSERDAVDGFVVEVGSRESRLSAPAQLVIEFPTDTRDYRVEREVRITPQQAGVPGEPVSFVVAYYPAQVMVLIEGDVAVGGPLVSDFLWDEASDRDIAFARQQWGGAVDAEATMLDRARSLAAAIAAGLADHVGVPSSAMSTIGPFAQFQRAIAGQDEVWCWNIAQIYRRACTAFGIPIRFVELRSVFWLKGERAKRDPGHVATEIYDREHHRWVWIDATARVLGVERQGIPLSLKDVHAAVTNRRSSELVVIEWDPETRSSRRASIAESLASAFFAQYLTPLYELRWKRRRIRSD